MLKNMAKNGMRAEHGDGWGLWALAESGIEVYHRETKAIWKSNISGFPEFRILFAHARKRGNRGAKVAIENTHPFLYRGAVFMHNGFININSDESCMQCTAGGTDSERFFVKIMQDGLESAIAGLRDIEVSAANFVMYLDGKVYVMRYARESEDYYSIYMDVRKDLIVLATEGPGEKLPNYHVAVIDAETFEIEYRRVFQDTFRQ
jgi:glutamine amidotransferase